MSRYNSYVTLFAVAWLLGVNGINMVVDSDADEDEYLKETIDEIKHEEELHPDEQTLAMGQSSSLLEMPDAESSAAAATAAVEETAQAANSGKEDDVSLINEIRESVEEMTGVGNLEDMGLAVKGIDLDSSVSAGVGSSLIDLGAKNVAKDTGAKKVHSDKEQEKVYEETDFTPMPVTHAGSRLVVRAKVNKALQWLEKHNDVNEKTTSPAAIRKILQEGEQLVGNEMLARGFQDTFCPELWKYSGAIAQKLSTLYCPAIAWPDTKKLSTSTPTWTQLRSMQPSMMRSAYSSRYLMLAILEGKKDAGDMLADSVCLWKGEEVCGKHSVTEFIFGMGWPRESKLLGPEEWICDISQCILKVVGFGKTACPVVMGWTEDNLADNIMFPFGGGGCWR